MTPVAEIVAEYIAYMYVTKTAWSARVDRSYLRRVFGFDNPGDPRIEVTYLEELTTAAVSRFLVAVRTVRKLAPKTCNRFREVLHRLVNWAMTQRDVVMPNNVNPVSRVERFRERRPGKRFLKLEDIGHQLEVLEPWPVPHAMAATFIYAGLRRSEALWLTCDDVDLKAGRHGMIRILAKTVEGVSWEPKTGQDRAVPVNSALRAILDVYAATQSPDRVWFFPSPKGKRWDPDVFSQGLRDLNRHAGFPWSALDYRHTFGSQLAMKGESLYKISALMGNSPEICRRHYAALLPESLVDSVEFPRLAPG